MRKVRNTLGSSERASMVKARGVDETELLSLAATVPFDDRINK